MSGGTEGPLPPEPESPVARAEDTTDAGAAGGDDAPGTAPGVGAQDASVASDQPVEAGGAEAGAEAMEDVRAEAGAEAGAEAMEEVLDPLTAMTIERDEYLDTLRRVQAEFENYKKRMLRQQTEQLDRAAESLVNKLLPVLDNLSLALSHVDTDATEEGKALAQLSNAIWEVLGKEGLEKVEPLDAEFDPNEAEAVMHEPGEEGQDGSKVVEVFRPGYRWRGRVLRAAMVKVRG